MYRQSVCGILCRVTTASSSTSSNPTPSNKAQSSSPTSWVRTLTRGGEFSGVSISGKTRRIDDFYHFVMDARWSIVLVFIAVAYIVTNTIFASLYLLGGDCIIAAQPGSFSDAFFFSVQTMATIGYGAMAPKTMYAHLLVTVEAIIGLFGVALATGVVFAKFARPTARVSWSDVALLTTRNGVPHLVFRVANARENQIVEASIRLSVLKFEVTSEGERMRRYFDMSLVRSQNPIFAMTWTVMHPIDENSPLHGMTFADMVAGRIEILAILTGLDSTFGQTIHARFAYSTEDFRENARFKDIVVEMPNGMRQVNLDRISDWEPMPTIATGPKPLDPFMTVR
jgi:inward rectifier potassium channel